MASSLLALIDDIASIMDDVAVLSKVAAKKTSGVLGDDLALNAEQVTGVSAEREIPIIFKVAKGSLLNKVIIVPLALLLSSFAPKFITPLLVCGGLFLAYEGFEKVIEKIMHVFSKKSKEVQLGELNEDEKVKGAIRTDFILSLEVIVITLGSVQNSPLTTQFLVLSTISIAMTFGVYGLVGLIVKIDDLGLFLKTKKNEVIVNLGQSLLVFAPLLMKFLGIAGTIAMFLVGGGIVSHSFSTLHHITQSFSGFYVNIAEGFVGITSGFICFTLINIVKKLRGKK